MPTDKYLPQSMDFSSPRLSKMYDSSKVELYEPFVVYLDDNYMISVEIEFPDVYSKYHSMFSQNEYSGNGYCWASQILQKTKPEYLKIISFDPESGGFYMYTNSRDNQVKVAKYLSAIFENSDTLNEFLKSADRTKIKS